MNFRTLLIAAASIVLALVIPGAASAQSLEDIYILRSIREPQPGTADSTAAPLAAPIAGGCAASRTGFEPFPADAERFFSFWSVRSQTEDGKVVDPGAARVAELRGCFGPTAEPARQNFYAEVRLGAISFRGRGECQALMIDFPEPGLFPVRCHLVLDGLPAPFVGGLLTTNTMTTKAAFGGASEPPGYTQASIATIRLWKARPAR